MSVYDPQQAITVPGRLFLNPTAAGMRDASSNYGGTPLGIKSNARLIREQVYAWKHSEAYGRDAVSGYGGRYKASFVFVLVQYDTAALRNVWAYSTTNPNGFADPVNIFTIPKAGQTTLAPGALVATSPLLFAADDYLNHPSVLVLSPLWSLGAKLELDYRLNAPLETSIVVVAGMDANGNDVRVDLVQNLTLT